MSTATAQPQFGLACQAPRPGLDQHSPLAQPGFKKALALYGRTVAVKRSAAAKSIQALRVRLRPAGMAGVGNHLAHDPGSGQARSPAPLQVPEAQQVAATSLMREYSKTSRSPLHANCTVEFEQAGRGPGPAIPYRPPQILCVARAGNEVVFLNLSPLCSPRNREMVAAAFSVAAKPLAGKAGVRRGARRATCTVRAAAAASEMVPDMDKRVRVPPCAGRGLHAWARPLAHTS